MRKDSLGLAKQVDLTTKQTTMEYYPPVESVSCQDSRQEMTEEETTGTAFPTGLDYGTGWWDITAKGAIRYASAPRILSSFLGAPTTTSPDGAGAPSARKHAFGSGVPVPHSLLVSRVDPATPIIDLPFGALGNQLTLSVDPNGFMQWEGAYVALDNDDTRPAPTVTLDNSARVRFKDAKVFLTVNGGSETEEKVAGWSVVYHNNVSTDEAILGTDKLYTLLEENRACEISFSPRGSLSAHYRRALLSDPDSVKIRLTATGALIGATTFFTIEWIVYACEVLTAPANIDAASRLKMLQVSARAKLDTGTGKFCEANVINTVTSY